MLVQRRELGVLSIWIEKNNKKDETLIGQNGERIMELCIENYIVITKFNCVGHEQNKKNRSLGTKKECICFFHHLIQRPS